MKNKFLKTTIMDIRKSLGRYIAMVIIIGLGVGLFSGLKISKKQMTRTAEDFLEGNKMYDLMVAGGSNIDEKLATEIKDSFPFIEEAEMSVYADVTAKEKNEKREIVLRVHSLTDTTTKFDLREGRMPENISECVADEAFFDSEDIGKEITVTDNSAGFLKEDKFTITGIGYSPCYMSYERGSTSAGNGHLSGFIYVLKDSFNKSLCNNLYINVKTDRKLSTVDSETYKKDIEKAENEIKPYLDKNVKYYYLYDRNSNAGYASFKNDSSVVQGIAAIFPVFFFMVAALVCVTTMTRMIDEQRTQIGIFKSLGYGKSGILGKYIIYSSSAGIIGTFLGYFLGTWLIPAAIWKAYGMIYYFSDRLIYVFDARLFLVSLLVSLLCTVGVTVFCCAGKLSVMPAKLMRPKAPKAGKRTIIEKLPFFNRISFFARISLRNMLRYKQRLFMMLLGISGCTALLVTGLGVKDSIKNVLTYQYQEILKYDGIINFKTGIEDEQAAYVENQLKKYTPDIRMLKATQMQLEYKSQSKTVNFNVIDSAEDIREFIDFHNKGKTTELPGKGQVIMNSGLAERMGIEVGDEIKLISPDNKTITFTLSGCFENYVGNYVFATEKSFDGNNALNIKYTQALCMFNDGADQHKIAADLMKMDMVSYVSLTQDNKERVDNMMKSLNYIVIVVILCAAALAFVVLYNLTNINIVERLREIATVKVLGFYEKETMSYIFRENYVMSVIGGTAGLLFGKALHIFVMSNLTIESVYFDIRVNSSSYVVAFALTVLFTFIVKFFMKKKIRNINMAESLKQVE